MPRSKTRSKDTQAMTKAELLAEVERLEFFINTGIDPVYDWDIGKEEIFISENLSKVLEQGEQWITPTDLREAIHPAYRAVHREYLTEHFKGHTERTHMEIRLFDKGGNRRWVVENGIVLRDADGKASRYVAAWHDISDQKLTERQLLESNSRLLAITENASMPITLKDISGRYVLVNNIFCKNRGLTRNEVIGKSAHDLYTQETADAIANHDKQVIASGKAMKFELNPIGPDGQIHTFISERFPVFSADGTLINVGSINADITEHKKTEAALRNSEREMRLLAATDALTGAKNRRSFFESGSQELARAIRYKRPLSVLMMDIDHFKMINDTHGHAVGDEVLKHFVNECHDTLREQDTLGRLGGEEFGVLLPEISIEHAKTIAERLRQNLMALKTMSGDHTVCFTVSIGLGQCDAKASSINDAMTEADAALYRAKQGGRNRIST